MEELPAVNVRQKANVPDNAAGRLQSAIWQSAAFTGHTPPALEPLKGGKDVRKQKQPTVKPAEKNVQKRQQLQPRYIFSAI